MVVNHAAFAFRGSDTVVFSLDGSVEIMVLGFAVEATALAHV
jgi:hypothetical protein